MKDDGDPYVRVNISGYVLIRKDKIMDWSDRDEIRRRIDDMTCDFYPSGEMTVVEDSAEGVTSDI